MDQALETLKGMGSQEYCRNPTAMESNVGGPRGDGNKYHRTPMGMDNKTVWHSSWNAALCDFYGAPAATKTVFKLLKAVRSDFTDTS